MRKTAFILILLVSVITLFSCKKDETQMVISSNPALPAITNKTDGAIVVFDLAHANDTITYEWSLADFGFQAVATYTLQMDKKGNDFASPITLGTTTNAGKLYVITNDLNNKLLAVEVNPEEPVAMQMEFRVKVSLAPNEAPYYSAILNQTMTPFFIPLVYPFIHVPGSYQGWDVANETTVIYSLKSDNKYEGYLWFGVDNAEFKYTEGASWDVNWGDNGADGTLEAGGANILAGGLTGYYKLNVNLNDKTHTLLRTDWGLIGSATPGGWDSDQNMTYNADTRTMVVTVDLTIGDIKFRANDGWDLNYGDDDANGKLDAGGANIAITEAGNYTVTLDLSHAVYKYKLKKN
jgi:starch-binding outer membrane protein SusE/F